MIGRSRRQDDLGPIITGVLDVLLAFSIALERRGLLTRAEIADTLRTVKDQVEAQEGDRPTRRTAVADWLLPVFDAPIAGADARSRLHVIDGGGS
jgi:hypothetical protein